MDSLSRSFCGDTGVFVTIDPNNGDSDDLLFKWIVIMVECGELELVDDHVVGLLEMLMGSVFLCSEELLLSLILAIDAIEEVTCCPECSEIIQKCEKKVDSNVSR
jgi:hypothetical protein